MNKTTSAELLSRFQNGSEEAADELFARYVARLTLLARSRLSPKLAARTDPEDIVLSAYRSFFIGAREGQFVLERSGDLWRLLVSITLHKLYHQERSNRAAKRSVEAESPFVSAEGGLFGREPSPDEAIAIADQLESLMASLDRFGRRVLELRLQEENLAAIASDTGRSERTVRRTLETIRQRLTRQLGREDDE